MKPFSSSSIKIFPACFTFIFQYSIPAYIYDFNYKFTLQKIKEDKFLTKLYSRFDIANNKARESLGNVYNFAKEYLDKELSKAI